jgi:hypothetical protein
MHAITPRLFSKDVYSVPLRALHTKLEEREDKTVSSESLISLAEFVLKNNYFEFNSNVYCEISRQPWAPNLLLRTPAFLWIWWRRSF